MLLQDDVSTKLSKEVYKNIIKSGLHRVVVKTPVLPCLDVIEWITRKIDHEDRSILNYERIQRLVRDTSQSLHQNCR